MELFQEQPPKKSDKPTWQEWSSYKQEMIHELGYEKKIAAAKKNPKTSTQILAARSNTKTTGWEGWEKMIIKGGEPYDAVQDIRQNREET